ncbi:RNA polymerase II transcription factor B 52 kDa subunit [Coelomomyces lativittatus]|nr:RNA polymerase II transcription factor B 52 kDa subunit [Coelomomyces lativittatus]KAJ1506696.1 RNA polymerase II transcription factor B 52 kDa subunit [Coelomomyces lativittatus]
MQHLVTGYLRNLPSSIYPQLFEQPASCLAVYRLLPLLSQQILARLLFVRQPISQSDILEWCEASASEAFEYALEQCKSLKCLLEVNAHFQLNETFRIQFQNALTGGGESRSFGSLASSADRHPINVAFLDRYAKEQWESVLRYMVGKHDAKPHTAVVNLLEKSGLMQRKR